MILPTIILSLLLLQLPLCTLQAPVNSPLSIDDTLNSEKLRYGRKPLPKDLDLEKTSLRQLVDMRPRVVTDQDGRLFRNYFANHPQVKKINLHDTGTAATTRELLKLTNDGTFDRSSKRKAAASIQKLIDDTHFQNEAHRSNLIKKLKGARYRSSIDLARKNYLTKIDKGELAQKRREAGKRHREEHGGDNYAATKKKLRKENEMMDQPLSRHLGIDGSNLTPQEVEIKARELGSFYSSELLLTRELKKYLEEKETSPEEIDAVVGIRQLHNNLGKEAQRKAIGKGKAASSTSDANGNDASGSAHAHPEASLAPSHQVQPLFTSQPHTQLTPPQLHYFPLPHPHNQRLSPLHQQHHLPSLPPQPQEHHFDLNQHHPLPLPPSQQRHYDLNNADDWQVLHDFFNGKLL